MVLGGGYHPHFDEVHDAVEAECVRVGASSSGVAWLRQDGTKPAPTVGTPEYAKAQMLRVRELLARLLEEGQLGNGEMKVHWY